MKLLIAEDDLTSRTILESITPVWQFQPISVEDGEQAWQILQQEDPPQLLLLDWEMPRLSGTELCRRIRQLNPDNPPYIILLTCRSHTTDVVEGLSNGANDYITKPVDNAELRARLQVGERVLALQKQLRQATDILSAEREVLENILIKMHSNKPFDGTGLRRLEAPVEKISGDLLLSGRTECGSQYLMLGDFTGHGLTAAIGGPVVADTFYSMTAKNLPLHAIATEINCRLHEKMPVGLFLAATFIALDASRRQLTVINLGMQDVLLYRGNQLLHQFPSVNISLGIRAQPVGEPPSTPVEPGDRIYAYSDGITETTNVLEEEFGEARLQQAISEMLRRDLALDDLSNLIADFRGDQPQHDDITLVELSCSPTEPRAILTAR